MNLEEKQLDNTLIYDGRVVKLYKDRVLCPNGNESIREYIRHSGGAAILCINSKKEVLLIKQFRYAYNEVMYEIPAGKLEKNEEPLKAAIREFEEETGNKTNELKYLGKIYPTCGYTNEILYLYFTDKYEISHTHFDEDEMVLTEFIPLDKVRQMINDGIIKDAKTICAIYYYDNMK